MGSESLVVRIPPVVEFSGEIGSDSWNSGCQEVREALEKYGCFEFVYKKHSIENQNAILKATDELFNVPDEIKKKNMNFSYRHGYVGKSPTLPIYESARIENVIDKQECHNFTHLMWPQGNQHFCETVHSHAKLIAEIFAVVLKMLCESYGIEKEYTEAQLKLIKYLMLMLRYERLNQSDTNVGLIGHADSSFLSILHQNHINGLEIRIGTREDHHWVPYNPSSHSSFVVLAGDVCTGWSNGRIKSCYHRVMVEGEEVRYAIAMFTFFKGLIKAPKELVDEEHPLKYKPFEHEQYLDFHTSNKDLNMDVLKAFCGI